MKQDRDTTAAMSHVEEVEVRGHIIDSLILPKVLDLITAGGGAFHNQTHHDRPGAQRPQLRPGRSAAPTPTSSCRTSSPRSPTTAPCPPRCTTAQLVDADMDGAFPEGFYSTTNQRTEVRLDGHWIEVADQEMDCGVVVDPQGRHGPLHADDRRQARHADRRRPRRRARVSAKSAKSSGRRSSS